MPNTDDIDSKIRNAFNYAVNFYASHDRSEQNQRFCLQQLMNITGFDADTCCKIQTPIMNAYMMGELIQIGNEISRQHLEIITHNIRQHLLSIQPTLQNEVVRELPYIPNVPSNTSAVHSLDEAVTEQIPSNGNYDLVSFSNRDLGYKGIEHLLYNEEGKKALNRGTTNLAEIYQGMLAKPGVMIVKLDLSNCNIGALGADKLGQAIYNGSNLGTLQHLNLSNNNIDDSGIYAFGNNVANSSTTPSLRSLNFSNNILTDNGASSLSWSFKKGNFYYLKELDVSGNQITDSGAQSFADALRQGMPTFLQNLKIFGNNLTATGEKALALAVKYSPNEMMAVTLDRVKSSGALDFIKKAFNYYAQEHHENNQEIAKAALALYGDDNWANCKRLLEDASRDFTLGVVKISSNPLAAQIIQKAPRPIKKFIKGGIFLISSVETVAAIDIENLGYCIAAVNEVLYGSGRHDPEEQISSVNLIGGNGEYEEIPAWQSYFE